MFSKLKWLILIQLLLTEQSLCRVPPPPPKTDNLLQATPTSEDAEQEQDSRVLLASSPQPGESEPTSTRSQNVEKIRSAQLVTSTVSAKLQGQIRDHLQIRGSISCAELLHASAVDDPLSSVFPQELLGLSLVPVLVASGCPQEAQLLVLKLYDLLGKADTEELLMDLVALMERKMSRSTSASTSEGEEASQHIDGVMFNIQQLALVRDGGLGSQEGHCDGWSRVNGTMLLGTAVRGAAGRLEDAVRSCERLGVLCAGVTSGGPLMPGMYQAVLKKGSRIFPSTPLESECWIRQCSSQDELFRSSGQRMKRSPQRSCINKDEERVYNVVEWIPAVSTLYSLGTAVYYASINCSATAKERAILSAVDLGTDALMVATGGTVGVAGYAVGAGVKTGVKAGVKYLLNSMKAEDDVLVNQSGLERGTFTVE
ncbi:uncharacterized protein apof [Poecilia reticulata]|uniref:Apolipoprotein F n=1 Tax=Poecilia reticulata TaxID=8081 RepID=A0A3P9PT47_POERE|nr:PREDICTED: apolipoprotein F [Poecilia reticulata]